MAETNAGLSVLSPFLQTRLPDATDDSNKPVATAAYPGKFFFRTDTGGLFICRDDPAGAAVWLRLDMADFFGYVAGNWHHPYGIGGATATATAPGANVVRLYPFINKQRATLAALGLRPLTVAAGGNAQAAVYAAEPATKRPTGVPLTSTPSMSTAVATPVNATISLQLEPGLYWLATMVDNATATFISKSPLDIFLNQIVGTPTDANSTGNAGVTSLSIAASAFGAWPDLSGAALTENFNASNCPFVRMKIGSVP